jgi:hypothetical protein
MDEIEETFEFVADDHEVEIKVFENSEILSYLDNKEEIDNIEDSNIIDEIEEIKEQKAEVNFKHEEKISMPTNTNNDIIKKDIPKAPASNIPEKVPTEEPIIPPTPMGTIEQNSVVNSQKN